MTPVYLDNSISAPSSEPVLGLRFAPAQATSDYVFSEFLNRASQDAAAAAQTPAAATADPSSLAAAAASTQPAPTDANQDDSLVSCPLSLVFLSLTFISLAPPSLDYHSRQCNQIGH